MTVPPEMTPAHSSGNTSPFEAIREVDERGNEFWRARRLMSELEYDSWRNFEAAIKRAKAAAVNSETPGAQFVQVAEVVAGGNLGPQTRTDYMLSRFAAYLLVMNGDPTQKPKVAEAQRYFAIKTRQAETTAPVAIPDMSTPEGQLAVLDMMRGQIEARVAAEQGREIAEERVAELEPAAETWHALADAAGDLSLRDAAQILSRDPDIEIGQNRLAKLLRQLGWIDKKSKRPYQDQVARGRLSAIVSHWTDEDGETHTKYLARVTAKGLEALRGHLNGSKPLPLRFPHDDVWGEAS